MIETAERNQINPFSQEETRQFNGIVNSFKKSGIGAHGIRQYEVSVVPWFWFLKNTQDCQVFQNKSIIDIFQAICTTQGFSDYDLSNLKANYQAIPYCVQYQESYFEFINRMLAEQGIAYYFKHAAGKHTMVLFDQKSPAGTPIATPFSNAPLRTPHIHEWIKERGTNSTQVVRRDYDYATPADPLISSSASGLGQASIDGVTAFSQFSYPGNYSNKSTGAALCTQAMTHLASKSYLNTGKGNVVDFSPGVRFMLGGHDDSQLNTAFLLLEVEHTAFDHSHTSGNHAAKGSDTEETHSQQYSNTFVCLPASIPYAPSPYQTKPKVAGVQSAKVLGASPEQPHVDEYGCVKVLFEWDRYSKDAETSSCWVRVAQAWAGNGRGIQFMPRVGSEVLVSFIDGDANRPIIVGTLNNGENFPLCKLPDNQDVSGVTTQMLGSDAASCNQLLLGDTQDKEFLLVNAAKDLNVSVVQNESTTIEANWNLQASNLLRQITAGKHVLACGQTITIQGGMSQIVLTQSSITFTAPAIKRSGASKMMIQAKGVGGTYPVARIGDYHNCHKICITGLHIGGALYQGSPTFKDGGLPVSRVGDSAHCHPVSDSVADGVPSILIDGKQIARLGNKCSHGGVITEASSFMMVADLVPVPPMPPLPGMQLPCGLTQFLIKCKHYLLQPLVNQPTREQQHVVQVIAGDKKPTQVNVGFGASCNNIKPSKKHKCATYEVMHDGTVTPYSSASSIPVYSAATVSPTHDFVEFFQQILLPNSGPETYTVQTVSCTNKNRKTALIEVFPEVEWEGSVSVGFSYAPAKNANKEKNWQNLDNHGSWGLDGEISVTRNGEKWTLGGSADKEASANTNEHPLAKQLFSHAQDFLNSIIPFVASIKNFKALGGALDVDIEWPKLELSGSIKNVEDPNNYDVGLAGNIKVALSPLFGFGISIDIIDWVTAILGGPFGAFIVKIKERIAKGVGNKSIGASADISLILSMSQTIEGSLEWKKELGSAWDTSGNVEANMPISLKGQVIGSVHVFVVKAYAGVIAEGASGVGIAFEAAIEETNIPSVSSNFKFNGLTVYWAAYYSVSISNVTGGTRSIPTDDENGEVSYKKSLDQTVEILKPKYWPQNPGSIKLSEGSDL